MFFQLFLLLVLTDDDDLSFDFLQQQPPVLAVGLLEPLGDGPRDDRLEARDRDRSLEDDATGDAEPRRR